MQPDVKHGYTFPSIASSNQKAAQIPEQNTSPSHLGLQRILRRREAGSIDAVGNTSDDQNPAQDDESDIDMRSHVDSDWDGYESDATMRTVSAAKPGSHPFLAVGADPFVTQAVTRANTVHSLSNEADMTVDQFTTYRSCRTPHVGQARRTPYLMRACQLRGHDIQAYVSKMG